MYGHVFMTICVYMYICIYEYECVCMCIQWGSREGSAVKEWPRGDCFHSKPMTETTSPIKQQQ